MDAACQKILLARASAVHKSIASHVLVNLKPSRLRLKAKGQMCTAVEFTIFHFFLKKGDLCGILCANRPLGKWFAPRSVRGFVRGKNSEGGTLG